MLLTGVRPEGFCLIQVLWAFFWEIKETLLKEKLRCGHQLPLSCSTPVREGSRSYRSHRGKPNLRSAGDTSATA